MKVFKIGKKGETMVETLISLVMITLALLILPGAIISSARVNKTVEDQPMYGGDGPETVYGTDPSSKLKLVFYREGYGSEYEYDASMIRYGDENKTKAFLFELK